MCGNALSLTFIMLLVAYGNCEAFSVPKTRPSQSTRSLLAAMNDVKNDSESLAALFKVGDKRIQDLIEALDDPDKDISTRAQIAIRYLGSEQGMRELIQWYAEQPNEYSVAGPIPLPLSNWDYKFINTNLIGRPPETWSSIAIRYIYSLSIDDSQQSKMLLDLIANAASTLNKDTSVCYAIRQVQRGKPKTVITGDADLAKLVLGDAFFVTPGDQKRTSARVIALNGQKDKALLEVYINRGPLADEWYHIVIRKCGRGWKYFSITPVAVS